MEKSLATTTANASLVDWNDPVMQAQIRENYGKGLTDGEWNLFLGLGLATRLNPFLREIWCLKYGTQAATVFIGRDGYRRSAQNHPEYEYHYADAVYMNDIYRVVSGEVTHEYTLKDRGALVGGYCVVKRKSAGKPAVTFVELKEYVQKFGVWATKPATMIKKVAEAQGLRASFQELFAGTYEESEQWQEEVRREPYIPDPETEKTPSGMRTAKEKPVKRPRESIIEVQPAAPTNQQNEVIADVPAVAPAPAAPPFEETFSSKPTPEQTRRLYDAWAKYKAATNMPETESGPRRKALMKELYGVEVSTALDERQANQLIEKIEELTREASEKERVEAIFSA